MPEQPPKFDNLEDANKYYEDVHRGNKLLNEQNAKPPESITKDDVKGIVADALKESTKQQGDADTRIKKVMLQDEDVTKAIKKTFKEDKDYDQWQKEVDEGKVSVKEIELLQNRGTKILNAEAEEAKKADEKNVEPPEGANKKLSFQDGHELLNKTLSDPNKNPNRSGLTPEEKVKAQDLQAKEISEIMDKIDREGLNDAERTSLNMLNEVVFRGKTTNPDGSTVIQ